MTRKRIAFCSDDTNECTAAVRKYIEENHQLIVVDEGAWPALASGVGKKVASGAADFGVVMCWTGTGSAIAANKVDGVRAAQASDRWIAENARLWNDANVLALSLKRLSADVAVECLEAFLAVEQPDPEEADNITAVADLEREH